MAWSIAETRETYTRLLDEEAESRTKLERMQGELPDIREADEEAFAEAALADRAFPKRKEVGLRHRVDNEEVALAGYGLSHRKLLEEACEAVGEGRRPLDEREKMLLRRRVGLDEFLTSDERRRAWQQGGRVEKKTDPRPDDLIVLVEDAYGWLDRGFEAAQEDIRKEDGYKLAIAHIQEAKAAHRRQGHMPTTFRMEAYPNIVTEADYEFLEQQPTAASPTERPWPMSIQDTDTHPQPAARKE